MGEKLNQKNTMEIKIASNISEVVNNIKGGGVKTNCTWVTMLHNIFRINHVKINHKSY